jgi:hypothetical protein
MFGDLATKMVLLEVYKKCTLAEQKYIFQLMST